MLNQTLVIINRTTSHISCVGEWFEEIDETSENMDGGNTGEDRQQIVER